MLGNERLEIKLRQLNDHNPRDEGKTNKHGARGKQNLNF